MKPSTKRILSILFSGLLFIASLVVYANLIRPATAEISDKRSVVFFKNETFQNQQSAAVRVQDLITQSEGIPRLQGSISSMIPTDPNVTQILNQLDAIVRSSRVDLSSFSISLSPFLSSGQPLVRRLGVLNVNFSVFGPYEGIKSFLQNVETNIRLFNVDSIQITPVRSELGGRDDFSGGFTAVISAEVYYQE